MYGRIVTNIQKIEDGNVNNNYSQEEIRRYVDAIIEVIDNKEYDEMKENCRNRIENYFTTHKMIEHLSKNIEELIQKGSTISKEVSNNEELYKQYLLLFNEIDRRYYNCASGGVLQIPSETEEQKNRKELEEARKQINQQEMLLQQEYIEKEIVKKELDSIYNSKRWKYMNKIVRLLKGK